MTMALRAVACLELVTGGGKYRVLSGTHYKSIFEKIRLLFRTSREKHVLIISAFMLTSSIRYLCASKSFTQKSNQFYTSATPINPLQGLLQLLQSSINHQSLSLSKQSHARIISLGFDQDPFLATKLITAYSICGAPSVSRLVFDSICHKNVFLWNSLISAYAKNRIFEEPFCLFNRMCIGHESPDNYTFATLSKICGELRDLGTGKAIHCRIVRAGFSSDTVVMNSVMAMYCKCDNLGDARDLFDEMPHRSVASWNVVISECAVSDDFCFSEERWKCVKQMQIEGMKPDAFTVASLLPFCTTESAGRTYGREIHCFIIRNGLGLDSASDLYVGSCLIDMYSKSKNVVMGRQVFDQMKCKNVVAWTAMISGYAQNGGAREALMLFPKMQERGVGPNRVSIVSILPACSSLASLMEGKQIHGFAVRSELNYDVSVSNALIDMYSKCGSLKCARHVFDDESFCKDTISWSSMITGYGLHGRGEEAVALFNNMLQAGINPDNITSVGVLSACSRAGLITEGFEIYNLLTVDYGILPTMEIYSCVVDMLGRAGQLDQALNFINSMPVRPGPSIWGALFSASVLHGRTEMRDLAYGSLLLLEPENPSNYVSLSNIYASSGMWDGVAEVRMQMKERKLRKLPGCSWISVNSKFHCFYVADKSHPSSDMIYSMLDNLILMIKGDGVCALNI
ncbi:pentatricopeptide repeat-containing protein At3g12770-like [Magnolia sinica]|uniref:pentatricopeptide repeat-containing protein At3g12770-like n=1 Tax=Magnolia sinica TaxID=86752 RepID=UPI002658483A|nr:pentatricopeptide repeat-containing protein At3g12770-like [Magnolia sinica]